MRTLQKIVRNGNGIQVGIPRQVLTYLGWLPGSFVILEVLEDKSIRLRPPAPDEFAPKHQKIVVLPDLPGMTP